MTAVPKYTPLIFGALGSMMFQPGMMQVRLAKIICKLSFFYVWNVPLSKIFEHVEDVESWSMITDTVEKDRFLFEGNFSIKQV